MIGPSSSHTAGACRIANGARSLARPGFSKARFYLHGSFAQTYLGHGTDKALLAGILGYSPKDPALVRAYELAEEARLSYEFIPMDLGDVHPNTVRIVLDYDEGPPFEMTGSSVGGGNIHIIAIDGHPLLFKNQFPTVILQYEEQPGVIAAVSKIITWKGHNIESVNTEKVGNFVTLILEISTPLAPDTVEEILRCKDFLYGKYLNVIS